MPLALTRTLETEMTSDQPEISNKTTEKPLTVDTKAIVSDADFELAFKRDHPIMWLTSLIGPAIAAITILGVYYSFYGEDGIKNLAFAILATFLALGRFVILFGGQPIEFTETITFQMSSEALFVMVTTMDFLVAFFVAFHMGILFRIPIMGPKLEDMVSDGRFILKHQPWIRNVAFIGLVLFVIFPSSTTGSIGGSIFGRLLGMKRTRVVTAILIGSLLGNGLMYMMAGWISQYIEKDNIWLKIGGVGSMLIVLFFVERYYRKMKAKYLQVEADEAAAKEADATETAAANVNGDDPS